MECSSGFGADELDHSAPNTSSSQALEAPPTPQGRSARLDGRSAPDDPSLTAVRFPRTSGLRPDRTAIRPDRAVGLGLRHQVPERTELDGVGIRFFERLRAARFEKPRGRKVAISQISLFR